MRTIDGGEIAANVNVKYIPLYGLASVNIEMHITFGKHNQTTATKTNSNEEKKCGHNFPINMQIINMKHSWIAIKISPCDLCCWFELSVGCTNFKSDKVNFFRFDGVIWNEKSLWCLWIVLFWKWMFQINYYFEISERQKNVCFHHFVVATFQFQSQSEKLRRKIELEKSTTGTISIHYLYHTLNTVTKESYSQNSKIQNGRIFINFSLNANDRYLLCVLCRMHI